MNNQERELYEFGPFRLDPGKRLLLRDNQPVPLQLKAFETLLVLVRNSEHVVLKDDLMKAVWPNTFVEESNLAQNIFDLTKRKSRVRRKLPFFAQINEHLLRILLGTVGNEEFADLFLDQIGSGKFGGLAGADDES